MKASLKFLYFFVFLISVLFLAALFYHSKGTESRATIDFGSAYVYAEIADTPEERNRGLMFRTSLPYNNGMLFVFDSDDYQSFWMKNTLIPLDIIFVSSNYTIVDITTMKPCEADPCPVYTSAEKAKYVIEVNGGFANANGIEAGSTLFIDRA